VWLKKKSSCRCLSTFERTHHLGRVHRLAPALTPLIRCDLSLGSKNILLQISCSWGTRWLTVQSALSRFSTPRHKALCNTVDGQDSQCMQHLFDQLSTHENEQLPAVTKVVFRAESQSKGARLFIGKAHWALRTACVQGRICSSPGKK
jgi:hypothetical protein